MTREELIGRIDLGKDPEGNLRSYAKLGIIPKLKVRGLGRGESVIGEYPDEVLDILREIKELKKKKLSLSDITRELKKRFPEFYMRQDLETLDGLNFGGYRMKEEYRKHVSEMGRNQKIDYAN